MSASAGRFAIELPAEPDDDLASDLRKQGGFVSPHVRSVRVAGRALEYELDTEAPADIHDKVKRYVQVMVGRYRKLPRKVVGSRKRSAPSTAFAPDAFAQLEARGWARSTGPGTVSLAGPALAALRAVDADIRANAVASFGAREEGYPTLIPTRVLARCGYFSSFPHSVSVVTHLVEDFERIEAFRAGHVDRSDHAEIALEPGCFVSPECCLSPALCYHCYSGLEGTKLSAPQIVTTVGRCFRYESISMTGLERLWDFGMREIVFVGSEAEVRTLRTRGIELVKAQLERWDLAGQIESANDPFFAAAYANKTYAQLRGELKYELRLPLAEGAHAPDLACASFNLHDDFFGRTFSITTSDGRPAFTSCVGWGLERWVLALFTQHGFTPANWPESLRASVWG